MNIVLSKFGFNGVAPFEIVMLGIRLLCRPNKISIVYPIVIIVSIDLHKSTSLSTYTCSSDNKWYFIYLFYKIFLHIFAFPSTLHAELNSLEKSSTFKG